MKTFIHLIIISVFLLGTCTLFAQAPRTFSYQGSLLDAVQKPVNGIHHLTVKLYDSPVEGNLLHAENFSSQIVNGIFNVVLGSETALESAITFDKQYWLGVSIDDDRELLPRTAVTSIPYAIHADEAAALSKNAKGAVTTMNGKSGNLTIKGGLGTDVQTEGSTITITANPLIFNGGGASPQGSTQVAGTANQVFVNGTSGSFQSGNVTLTLPQNINTGATPQFANLDLTGIPSGSTYTNVLVSNGGVLQTRTISSLGSGVTSAIGTANQINVSSSTGDVTFSLPQNIDTGATPKFTNLNLSSIPNNSSYTEIVVSNGGTLQTRSVSSLPSDGVPSGAVITFATGGTHTGYTNLNYEQTIPFTGWTPKSASPNSRSLGCSATVNGKIYAIGGISNNTGQPTNLCEQYDPSTDTWTTKASMPTARGGAGCAVIDNKIFVVGGYTSGPSAVCEMYDPSADTWTSKASMPTPRYDVGVASTDSVLYAIGGHNNDSLVTINEMYDPISNSWTRKSYLPSQRYAVACAFEGGNIYVIGGFIPVSPSFATTNEMYTPSTDTWTSKASAPTGQQVFQCAVLNNLIYSVNAANQPGLNNNYYDASSDSWHIFNNAPAGIAADGNGVAGVVSSKIYTLNLGTSNRTSGQYDPTFEIHLNYYSKD